MTQTSFSGQMAKRTVVHPRDGILLSNKKKRTWYMRQFEWISTQIWAKKTKTKTNKNPEIPNAASSVSNIVEMMTFQRWGRSVLDPRWRVGCGYNATAWETLGEVEFLGPDCQRQDRGCDFTPQFRTMLPLSEAGENGRGISRHCFLLLHANLQWSQNQGVQLKNSAHVICSIF